MFHVHDFAFFCSFLLKFAPSLEHPNPITGPKQSTCEPIHLQLSNLDHWVLNYFRLIFYPHGKNHALRPTISIIYRH
jgi:hypothetical protein